MWPFKSNIPTLEQITTENDGNTITVVLSKGAHKFSKEEVLDLRLTSDVFSPKIKNHSPRYFLWGLLKTRPLPLADSTALQVITFLLFGGFLNLFILYFYSLYLFEIFGSIILCALPLSLICTICVYLIFIYLLKCFQVAKRKDHPELDLYFEDIVTLSLNNCVIQFRMTDQNLNYFYDTTKDSTTFGFLINKRKKLVEKADNSRLEIIGFLFFLLIGFTVLYFFWETPFWFYDFVTHVDERLTKIQFYESHKSMFQFFNYYRSDEISFFRAFFDGMVSNLISISLIIGIFIIILIIIVLFLIAWFCFLFDAFCVYLIIIQIFAYFCLNSKLHRFLSKREKEKYSATIGIGLIISLLLSLLSIYLGIIYLLAFNYPVPKNIGMLLIPTLPLFTYLVLQFFLRNTTFAKKSRAGIDQFVKNGLDSLLLPLILFSFFTSLYNKYGIDVKETESSEKI